MSCAVDVLRHEQPYHFVGGPGDVGSFLIPVRIGGEQIGRPITMRLFPIPAETTGKNLIQLDCHSLQPKTDLGGNLGSTFLHPSQIPAGSGGDFHADPVSDFDLMAKMEIIGQHQFTRPAASLPV